MSATPFAPMLEPKSGLVFYREMLTQMKIAIPAWLKTVGRDKPNPKRKKYGAKAALLMRGLNPAHYYMKTQGRKYGVTVYRNTPKRDKSITARQWRIRRNRLRQATFVNFAVKAVS